MLQDIITPQRALFSDGVQTILRGVTVAKDREIVGEPMGHFVKAQDNGVLC